MRQRVLWFVRVAAIPVAVLCGAAAKPVFDLVCVLTVGRTVQSIDSPNGGHEATLLRKNNLADFNFIVTVDGRRVYESPDLMPFVDHAYRETLVWDTSGRIVVLELMGKHVFAYDANEQRPLTKGELSRYTLYPQPSDYVYVTLHDIDE